MSRQTAQATVEYLGLGLLVLVVVVAAATAAARVAAAHPPRGGDRGRLALAARHTPLLALETGGDVEQPVDFRRCREVGCAGAGARPVLFAHVVRSGGYVYLEYWEYLPDSRFAHTGLPPVDGYHRDDWE
ncbi:MAG TPA: hypothetical protein VMU66_06555, partial [Gaiellales bacterium]|nr:hypothetical protein [Gaiellales bacterium]